MGTTRHDAEKTIVGEKDAAIIKPDIARCFIYPLI